MGLISAAASILASLLKGALGIFSAKNTAAEVKVQTARNTQASDDQIQKDVAAGDIAKVRDELAE